MTVTQRDRLNNDFHPTAQEVGMGDALIGAPVALTASITAAADSTALSITVPVKIRVTDVVVLGTTANASGTVTLRKGTSAISDAIDCAVDKAIDRASTIDVAHATVDTTDDLNVITNATGDRGHVTVFGVRV